MSTILRGAAGWNDVGHKTPVIVPEHERPAASGGSEASRKLQFEKVDHVSSASLAHEVSVMRRNIVNRLASENLVLPSPVGSPILQSEEKECAQREKTHEDSDPSSQANDVSTLQAMLAEVKMDRTRLEHMLVRAEMQQLGEKAAAETKHDEEAHAVVEDLCEQLLHERLQRLRCLEIVRDLCYSLGAGDENLQTGEWHKSGDWDQALGQARCLLQDACDEWDAARGAGSEEKLEISGDLGPEQQSGRGLRRGRRGEDAAFAQCLEEQIRSEARHGKLVQVCFPFLL